MTDAKPGSPLAWAEQYLVAAKTESQHWAREGDAVAVAATAIIEMEKALALHQAWSDSERAGPDYGAQTRDTHPDGESIWRKWWHGQLDLCSRAQDATYAALRTVRGES